MKLLTFRIYLISLWGFSWIQGTKAQVLSQPLMSMSGVGEGIGRFDHRASLCRSEEGRMGLGLWWDLRGPEAPSLEVRLRVLVPALPLTSFVTLSKALSICLRPVLFHVNISSS